jgi:hypothetical protein
MELVVLNDGTPNVLIKQELLICIGLTVHHLVYTLYLLNAGELQEYFLREGIEPLKVYTLRYKV